MNLLHKYSTLILSLFISSSLTAQVRLPSIFSDNMVLQQQSSVTIWGWSGPYEKIYITNTWNNTVDSTQATFYSQWSISINTPSAGGPYTITINNIQIKNVMIGEVWICSGQSNMWWNGLAGIPEIDEVLPISQNSNIRFFQIAQTTSNYPQDNCAGTWKECNAESLKGFSAVAYFFGRKLQDDMNIPIGLINSSWGGTPAEVWTSRALVENDMELKKAAGELPWWSDLIGTAYNAMIAPITSFSIAGAIWYQGEANVKNAGLYDKLMRTLIGNWRKEWNKEVPFYYVQIAPYSYELKYSGALLREAQTKTLEYPRTGMVVITDLVNDVTNIHPLQKKKVGERLAGWALSETYGQLRGEYRSPMYRDYEINKDKITISFNYASDGLQLKAGDRKATEFFIAGTDSVFVPANVKIDGNKVIVSSKRIKHPVAVRFSFSNTGIGNLFSNSGLPVAPFRTDSWEIDTPKEVYD